MKRSVQVLFLAMVAAMLLAGIAVAGPVTDQAAEKTEYAPHPTGYSYSYFGTTEQGEAVYRLAGQKVSRSGVTYKEVYLETTLNQQGKEFFHTTYPKINSLYRVDCAGHRFGTGGGAFYVEGWPVDERIFDTWEWEDIAPGTVGDTLWRKCCQ